MSEKATTGRGKAAAHAELVLKALHKARKPMSAYEIIAQLRPKADLAPPTVYRALDRLIAEGHVHRLESLNAFVGCSHKEPHADAAFAICDRCGSVTEFEAPGIANLLGAWSRQSGFGLTSQTVEIHGLCAACRADA